MFQSMRSCCINLRYIWNEPRPKDDDKQLARTTPEITARNSICLDEQKDISMAKKTVMAIKAASQSMRPKKDESMK
jgi:hypothetical protein